MRLPLCLRRLERVAGATGNSRLLALFVARLHRPLPPPRLLLREGPARPLPPPGPRPLGRLRHRVAWITATCRQGGSFHRGTVATQPTATTHYFHTY